MSVDESKINHYFEQVKAKCITLIKASSLLAISYRHTKRLWSVYKVYGAVSLISKKRGAPSNRRIPEKTRNHIASIISENYSDFKPTYAAEMLDERHGIFLSKETIRQIMIEHKIWFPSRTKTNVHQMRERRECVGELVQTDASKHLWFEDRGPECHLYIVIDDATSEIVTGYFEKEETTRGYFKTFAMYINMKGLPGSIYCDKRGTFKVNQGVKRGITQFARAMKELGVEMIFAHSPQAKGRAERAFETLQDRLIKEMRLENISTIEEGNKFLPGFFKRLKLKFAKAPASTFNAHRPLNNERPLKYILCYKHKRSVSNNLEVNFGNQIYQILPHKVKRNLKKVKIDVIITLEGEMRFEYAGENIEYKKFNEIPYQIPATEIKIKEKHKPKKHPKISNMSFSKVVDIRGYFETNETLSDAEKEVVEYRLKERRRISREDNIEIMDDKKIQGDII